MYRIAFASGKKENMYVLVIRNLVFSVKKSKYAICTVRSSNVGNVAESALTRMKPRFE